MDARDFGIISLMHRILRCQWVLDLKLQGGAKKAICCREMKNAGSSDVLKICCDLQ